MQRLHKTASIRRFEPKTGVSTRRSLAGIARPLSFPDALGPHKPNLLRLAVRPTRESILCLCGGRAARTVCTGSERARFGGERFARAFVCTACDARYVGRARP
jgi:hypothetical protein